MVVFVDGAPRKIDYKRFKIKTVVGRTILPQMRDVLTRTGTPDLNAKAGILPDLIVVDGGKRTAFQRG